MLIFEKIFGPEESKEILIRVGIEVICILESKLN